MGSKEIFQRQRQAVQKFTTLKIQQKREELQNFLKEQGIAAFSQEASASVAMHGAPGFGMYGVDVLVEGDEAKKAIQIIEAADDSQSKEKF